MTAAFAKNVETVGYDDLDGRSGFKLALHEADGRYYLYVAGLWHSGWSIVEVTDPRRPRFVRWLPGPANTWTIQVQVPDGLMVTSLAAYVDGERAYAPWMRAGYAILDVKDPTCPRLVGSLSVSPPLGSAIAAHSAIPLADRGLLVVNSEALAERCAEPLNYAGIVDVSDESDPTLISLFPLPEVPDGYPHITIVRYLPRAEP